MARDSRRSARSAPERPRPPGIRRVVTIKDQRVEADLKVRLGGWELADIIAVRVCVLHRARAERPRRPGRASRRVRHPPHQRFGAGAADPVAGQLRRRSVARRVDAGHPAGGAGAAARVARVRHPARRHPRVLRPREAGALAALPHPRLRGARRQRLSGADRRRVSQLRRRRGDRRGGHDVGAARHQHRDRGRGPRNSAGGRRLRDPAARGLFAQACAAAQPDVRRLPARWARSLPSSRSTSSRWCAPTFSRSPQRAFSTSRWPT